MLEITNKSLQYLYSKNSTISYIIGGTIIIIVILNIL